MAMRCTTYDYLFPVGCLLACRVLDLMAVHAYEVFANLPITATAGMIIGYSIADASMLISIVLSDLAAELQTVLCWFLISLSTELTTELWSLYFGDIIAAIQRVWNCILVQRCIRTLTFASSALNPSTALMGDVAASEWPAWNVTELLSHNHPSNGLSKLLAR